MYPLAVFATRNPESPITSELFNYQPWWLDSYGIISSSALNHAAGRHRCQPLGLTSLLKCSSSRCPVKSAPHQKYRFIYRFVLTTRCRAERSVVWFHRWNLGDCKSHSFFFPFYLVYSVQTEEWIEIEFLLLSVFELTDSRQRPDQVLAQQHV